MPRFKKVIDQAKALTIFVYGHTRTLECLRHFTEGREIIRPGVTRFASAFLTLNSILEKKDQLRKMVVHNRWDTLKDVKSKKREKCNSNNIESNLLEGCEAVFECF